MTLQGTVVDRKRQFLQSQKQILKRGIPLSNDLANIANEGGIPSRVLTDALRKVNRDLSRHARLVHSRQMTEHVVEQIDIMYWEAGTTDIEADTDITSDIGLEDKSTLYQSDDLTLDSNISKLPPTWDDGEENDTSAYTDASTRLHSLSAHRLTLSQKLNTYRTLLSLLEPYRQPKENIQPNLVGRDVPLAVELGKTRTLAIRVAGRVQEKWGDGEFADGVVDREDVEANEEDGNVVMIRDEGRSKLKEIMMGW